ncbi:MAG: 2-C-methyl-D-erythritol 2,4-cyclodiphosphate synthase [candidate division Zixibacteria bacterium]|nr:2-C-methyl-D-erythritol 2,4-cyclodiphosphate synthase [candidate division Zixibacteria bacterium]
MASLRIGHGFDVHRLVAGRRLVIGGVELPFDKGLEGHSDADVLVHAVMDALLGAAGLGDIGQHFPPTDPALKDADSLLLLEQVGQKIEKAGYGRIGNIDCTVMAEQPRLAPYVPEMKTRMAAALAVDTSRLNIKCTTTETLGFVGRGEGIAASAVCMISSNE